MKLFSKIATALVGIAMAVGVGVAVSGNNSKEVKADSTANFTLSSASAVTVDGVTASFAKGSGSNAPTWYAAGLRLYASNTVTISSSNTLTGVSFNWEKQGSKAFATVTADVGTYTHPSAAGTGTWTGNSTSVVFTLGSSGQLQLNTFSVTYSGGGSSTYTVTYNANEHGTGTMTDPNSPYTPGAEVTVLANAFVAKTDYEFVDFNTAADGTGTSYDAGDKFEISANTTLYAQWNYTGAGTADNPFTVVEALAKANEIGTVGSSGQGPWVTKGIISRVTSAPAATYWNATYYISDDGSQTNELQVYRGYYLDNAKFDAETAALLTAGKVVTVTGNLTGSYGCEYCQGNYLLSLESPSTGDIDVTFEPELNIEIGDTGTFTASTDATSPTYTWSVEDSSILSVDSSTGAFEGLKLGTTKVTVNVSATEGNGEASAFITVNGSGTYTIEEANEIAAAEASGSTTSYYIYVEGYVSLFNSDSQTAGNERALDITNYDQNESIMVFVGKSGYSTFISGLKLGDYIRVKAFVQNYSGKYELTTPTKVESYYTEMSFAYELLELTDAVCKDYDGVTDNKSKLETVWETLVDSSHYGALTSEQIKNLVDCEASETGTTVQQAMARYDYLVVKYELDNFISDRTPSVGAVTQPTISNNNNINSSMSIIVVAVIAITSLSAIGVLLVIKRRKSI